MNPWYIAVASVEHSVGCLAIPDELYGIGGCTCDRDARIAKGIEVAVNKVGYVGVTLHHVATAAFKEVSREK